MRLYECEQCRAVNRVSAFRLDMQPVCRACGHEIKDFPLSRQVRGTWKLKGTIFIACLAGAMAAIGMDWLRGRTEIKTASSAAISEVPAGPEAPRLSPPPGCTLVDELPSVASPPTSPSYSPPSAVRQANGVLYVDPKAKDRERVAPLSISTPSSGGGFFVKLLYPGKPCSYLRLFVNAGSRFETQVALGKYDIVFAIGERWLGRPKARRAEPCSQKVGKIAGPDEPFFWPSDSHYRFEGSFSFDASEDGVTGHEIQLINQMNGNLRKEPISEAEFGD